MHSGTCVKIREFMCNKVSFAAGHVGSASRQICTGYISVLTPVHRRSCCIFYTILSIVPDHRPPSVESFPVSQCRHSRVTHNSAAVNDHDPSLLSWEEFHGYFEYHSLVRFLRHSELGSTQAPPTTCILCRFPTAIRITRNHELLAQTCNLGHQLGPTEPSRVFEIIMKLWSITPKRRSALVICQKLWQNWLFFILKINKNCVLEFFFEPVNWKFSKKTSPHLVLQSLLTVKHEFQILVTHMWDFFSERSTLRLVVKSVACSRLVTQ